MNDRNMFSDALTRADVFAGIEKGELSRIFGLGRRNVYPSGATLFREGDPAVTCYLVLTGRLKLTKLHEEGKEILVRYVPAGQLAAVVALFAGKNYPVTAQVIERAEIIGWDHETMMDILLSHPRLAVNMLHAVIERMEELQSRHLELHAERAEQRIARAILRIMNQSGRKTDKGILIDFRLSRRDLADYTGTTLYTVSRTLSSWEKQGWITSGRERIVVIDPHALVLFAERD
ncbi:MAG: Crp/Fnr family transcriptional regulator [Syntrophobacteraceae bacterium]|nr:Crp/Fnr family transcriptional regulator [Syntrophobacteraceae bacterium]